MDERDSHCPYLLSSETAAKGTDLAASAGKEDPVELDSSLPWFESRRGVDDRWEGPLPSGGGPTVKYHYSLCF